MSKLTNHFEDAPCIILVRAIWMHIWSTKGQVVATGQLEDLVGLGETRTAHLLSPRLFRIRHLYLHTVCLCKTKTIRKWQHKTLRKGTETLYRRSAPSILLLGFTHKIMKKASNRSQEVTFPLRHCNRFNSVLHIEPESTF